MANWLTSDIGPFDLQRTDKVKIDADELWAPCRICREMFNRLRLTARYCGSCERAFCEGEHGSFVGRGVGVCVRCYNKSTMELRPTKP